MTKYKDEKRELSPVFIKRLDRLYRTLKSCDMRLINTSNELENDLDRVLIAYLFSISSYGLSFINNIFYGNAHSICNILCMRCLWESSAMYHHIYNGGFSEEGIELFKFQPYILERAIYKKYPVFDEILFSLNEIEEKYNHAKDTYKGKIDVDARTLAKLMRSPIPFLIKDNIPFVKIVEQNLGKKAAEVYNQLSILIHPHDYRSKLDDFFIDVIIEENPIIETTIELIEGLRIHEVLENLPKGAEIRFGLVEEAIIYLEDPFSHAYKMREILHSLGDDLHSVIMVAYEKKFPSLARILDQIRHFSIDYLLDTVFGYTEQCVIKWKAIVEYFALFNYYIDNPYYLQFNNLALFHTTVANLGVLDMNTHVMQEDKDECYAEYLKVFPNGVNQEAFERAYHKTLGFLVNENGKVPSLNELAKTFLEKASASIDRGKHEVALPKNKNTPIEQLLFDRNMDNFYICELPLQDWLTMLYEESQIMSHATGYLYFANSGAWTDGQILGEYIHKFERYTLKRLCEVLGTAEMKQKLGGKTLLNMVRNYHKNSAERMETFKQLLRMPKGGKPKM